jgi:hypothetical protein
MGVQIFQQSILVLNILHIQNSGRAMIKKNELKQNWLLKKLNNLSKNKW